MAMRAVGRRRLDAAEAPRFRAGQVPSTPGAIHLHTILEKDVNIIMALIPTASHAWPAEKLPSSRSRRSSGEHSPRVTHL